MRGELQRSRPRSNPVLKARTGDLPSRTASSFNQRQACDRCRSFKKKCSQTFPVCQSCASAGRKCSFSTPPETPEAEALQLRARVRWLSAYINDHVISRHSIDFGGIETVETGVNLETVLSCTSETHDQHDAAKPGPSTQQTNNIFENLETLSHLAQGLRDSQSTLLYLVTSLGYATPQRTTPKPQHPTKRFEVAFSETIQECVCRESIESVQVLMLLALYSLFTPAGPSAYAIVSIAARQAITLGLTCRPADGSASGYAPAEMEMRRRFYWSIFCLDRMMAVSQGLPVALADSADIPMPSLTNEELASAERAGYARQLQASRHVIHLRQLEGRVLARVHLPKSAEIANMTPLDRRAVLGQLRASADDWYSQGLLMAPPMEDGTDRNSTLHNSTDWLSARYYYLLVLLYYPSHFNSGAGSVSPQELVQFAQRQLQATSNLFQQQQLPLNRNTLYRLMPVCLVVLHEVAAMHTRPELCPPLQPEAEVVRALPVLDAFPSDWHLAHRGAQLLRQFSSTVSSGTETGMLSSLNPKEGSGSIGRGGGPSLRPITSCIAALVSLMREMLGYSTCFQYINYLEYEKGSQANDENTDDNTPARNSGFMMLSPHQTMQQQHQPQGDSLAPPQALRNDPGDRMILDETQWFSFGGDDTVSYGWGALDLDFNL